MCSCGKAYRQAKSPDPATLSLTAAPATVTVNQDQSKTIRQTLTREEFQRINFERKQMKPPPLSP